MIKIGGWLIVVSLIVASADVPAAIAAERVRVIIETDAGGDPDDEQSLVRFLLYANEFDIEGIIANRAVARERENRNVERTGLGIVERMVEAYADVYPKLVQHDPRYPRPEQLRQRVVPGHAEADDGEKLVLAAADRDDPRPVWFLNWGTDNGSGPSNLLRALDRVRRERGEEGYAQFKRKLRLSSSDKFGEHTTTIEPPFPLWVDTFRPEVGGKRWYHRFSGLTATAGGFDLERDALHNHGALGALYPTNTTHRQKEGDTMTFLYLVPTGMNDPQRPTWGSWAGRWPARCRLQQAVLLGRSAGRLGRNDASRQHAGALGRASAERLSRAARLVRPGSRRGESSAAGATANKQKRRCRTDHGRASAGRCRRRDYA